VLNLISTLGVTKFRVTNDTNSIILGATTLTIITFSIKSLFVTLSINDTQDNNTLTGTVMLSVAFYLLLC